MFDRTLRRMRELVRTSRYVMTVHGHEEMVADHLTVFDVEHCILTGEIVERQKDARTGYGSTSSREESSLGTEPLSCARLPDRATGYHHGVRSLKVSTP